MAFGVVGWQCLIGMHFGSEMWVDLDEATTEALENAWSSRTTMSMRLAEWPQYLYHAVQHSDGRMTITQRNTASGTVRELRRGFFLPR
jgi:hypothetical protein